MKTLLLRLVLATMCMVAAASAHAQSNWGNFVFVSSSLGNNGNRLCFGDGSRGSDIGCPTYAPYVSSSGNVGIGTTTPTTQLQISGTATMNVTRLISQTITTVAGGGGDRIVSGSTAASVGGGGYFIVSGSANSTVYLRPVSGSTSSIEVGHGQTGTGFAYIDFMGDATYSDYGLRIIRNNGGANTPSEIDHRGTGPLVFNAVDSGSIQFWNNTTQRINIAGSTGVITFNSYGAGTLTTNGSGVITASSDERLKDIKGDYTRGLTDITKLSPITYRWTKASGLDDGHAYSGFSAQDVQKAIPEAVRADSKGYLTLQDRPLIAASVNAIKELKAENDKLAEGLKAANDNIAAVRAELKSMQAGKK